MFSKKIGSKDLGQLVTAYCFKCDTTTTGYSGFGYTLKGFKQSHTCPPAATYNKATIKAMARHHDRDYWHPPLFPRNYGNGFGETRVW